MEENVRGINQKGLEIHIENLQYTTTFYTCEEQRNTHLSSKVAFIYWDKKGCEWLRMVGMHEQLAYFKAY